MAAVTAVADGCPLALHHCTQHSLAAVKHGHARPEDLR